MRQDIAQRCMDIGKYIARTGATVRQAAKAFQLSKSSVHKDMHERLRHVHPGLFEEVQNVLIYNKAVRHLRGGAATKQRYAQMRQQDENEK